MANLNAPMPTFATPFLRDGLVNEPWYRFLFQLQIRTGGAAGLDFATQAEFDALQKVVTAQGKGIDSEGVYTPFNPTNLLQRIETFVVPIAKTSDQKGAEVVYAPPYSYDTVAQAIARFAAPPAIGSTTPAAGTFTSLNCSSGALNANIGGTTPGTGAFTTITASSTITPSQTAGIVGTTTNNNANAGSVGEYSTNSAGPFGVSNGASANIVSISLGAGDWDVQAVIATAPAGTTVTSQVIVGVSTTSVTLGALGTYSSVAPGNNAGIPNTLATPVVRLSLSGSTTVFGILNTNFTVSTMNASGFIRARRVR